METSITLIETATGDGSFLVEEADHLQRSVKKIKASIEGDNGDVQVHVVCSFKDTMLFGRKDSTTVVTMSNIDKVTIDFGDDWVEYDKMADVPIDDTIPCVSIDNDGNRFSVFVADNLDDDVDTVELPKVSEVIPISQSVSTQGDQLRLKRCGSKSVKPTQSPCEKPLFEISKNLLKGNALNLNNSATNSIKTHTINTSSIDIDTDPHLMISFNQSVPNVLPQSMDSPLLVKDNRLEEYSNSMDVTNFEHHIDPPEKFLLGHGDVNEISTLKDTQVNGHNYMEARVQVDSVDMELIQQASLTHPSS
ncbi:hypothetical protein REPUB_Repub09cG0053700 [Reevesia pubescens]